LKGGAWEVGRKKRKMRGKPGVGTVGWVRKDAACIIKGVGGDKRKGLVNIGKMSWGKKFSDHRTQSQQPVNG